jgi:hypothetical protein
MTGHAMPLENPALVARFVRDFIRHWLHGLLKPEQVERDLPRAR